MIFAQVKHSIQSGHPMCVDYFQQGFIRFATIFAPYTRFCSEQSTCQYYCKELNRNNALFTAYLAWCEAQKECNRYNSIERISTHPLIQKILFQRLRLADILVRPMQRLTKYSLLLSAIRKHLTDENDSEIMDSMVSVSDLIKFIQLASSKFKELPNLLKKLRFRVLCWVELGFNMTSLIY